MLYIIQASYDGKNLETTAEANTIHSYNIR